MISQKGQAFDVFKLLIAAVVAVAILGILLAIIEQLDIFKTKADAEARTLIKDISSNPASQKISGKAIFENGTTLSNRALAQASGSLQEDQVCVLPGDFFDAFQQKQSWIGEEGISLTYIGTTEQSVKIIGICDTGKDLANSGYFESYAPSIQAKWTNSCGCINSENEIQCCILAIKRS